MAIVNSNNVTLLVATSEPAANAANSTLSVISNATSVTLDISRENIVVTNKASNSNVERIPGVKDWSASGEGQLDYSPTTGEQNASELQALMAAGTKVYIRYGIGDSRYVGGGYLTSVSQSAGTDDVPTFSFSLEGDGAIVYDADVTAA